MSVVIKIKDTLNNVSHEKAVKCCLIQDMIATYGDKHVIEFPTVYNDAVAVYVNWLNDVKLQYMLNPDVFEQCWLFESYIHDSGFFDYLIRHLLDCWDELSPVIYKLQPQHIHREVFLHCPILNVIPDIYITNIKFIKQWCNQHVGKKSVVYRRDKLYDYECFLRSTDVYSWCYHEDSNDHMDQYHRKDPGDLEETIINYGNVCLDFNDEVIIDKDIILQHFLTRQKHGEWKTWHPSGELKCKIMYSSGRIVDSKEYYITGQLKVEIIYSTTGFANTVSSKKEWSQQGEIISAQHYNT